MTVPDRRRLLIEGIKSIPAEHRAWISLPVSVEGFELFCYYGWGVVPNSAQLESANDVFTWPPGSVHIRRFGNRAGKTTGCVLEETYWVWKKWRYTQADPDAWLGYRYKVLHAAAKGKLMGKAWEMADALIAGTSIAQQDPFTNRQRTGIFVDAPWFTARTGKLPDGSDGMWLASLNGGQVDFLQTEDGAGRMESDAWWVIVWDEFGEHQPVANVPYLFNSTFLPRSSDFMAPIILSSTEKEHNAAVYAELEDIAERSPADFNLREYGREVNFAMSRESIDRQLRLSTDESTAQRSVAGGAAETSSGSLLARFTVDRAFDPGLRPVKSRAGLPPVSLTGREWKLLQLFDHAAKNDRNVVTTIAVPWPIRSRTDLLSDPARVLDIVELRGSRVLLPDEMVGFAVREYQRFGSDSIWFTDATGEAGIMVHRMLRQKGVPSRDFNFTARVSQTDRRTRKGHGRTGLMRLFSLGLPMDDGGRLVLPPGADPRTLPFGGIRIPFPAAGTSGAEPFRRLYRQLLMLRADDEKLAQDHAMTVLMGASFLYPYFEKDRPTTVMRVSPFKKRGERRGLARVR